MNILLTIFLIAIAVFLIIGLIRIIFFEPYKNFPTLLMELMLIDWMSDALSATFESIDDIWD